MTNARLSDLINIGRQTEQLLNEVSIHTKHELEKVGPVLAWRRIQTRHPEKATLQLLYRLAGALRGTHWNTLSEDALTQLHGEIEQVDSFSRLRHH